MSIDVSVVIPTIFRPELRRAVMSALAQDWSGRVEVLIVVDGEETHSIDTLSLSVPADRDVRLLHTGRKAGAPTARNIGVKAAKGTWIAFLDDDDEWLPNHLGVLLRASQGSGRVMCSRVYQVVDGRRATSATPDEPKPVDLPITDYLFRSRRPSLGRASIFTSTLMVSTRVALEVPWDESLRRHQDWDWLLRVEEAGNEIEQTDLVTALIQVGTRGSISASADWSSSLRWALSSRTRFARRTFADFLTAQTLRYALQARSFRGAAGTLRALVRNGRFPHVGPIAIALSALAPRRFGFGLAVRLASSKNGKGR